MKVTVLLNETDYMTFSTSEHLYIIRKNFLDGTFKMKRTEISKHRWQEVYPQDIPDVISALIEQHPHLL